MNTPLRNGHAAWVWLNLDGRGLRWHLAVPVDREDDYGDGDDCDVRWQALLPFEDYRMEVEELDDCVQRQVMYPDTPATAAELQEAEARDE